MESANGIALVTLDRPEKSHAFDLAMIEALGAAIDGIENDPEIRVAILTATGAAFSAGGDLDYFAAAAGDDPLTPPVTAMRHHLSRIADSEQVWIAAVNGAAVGGGLELALACHLRLASASAVFSMRHRKLGLAPGWGGGERLFDAVGSAAGLWLLITAETIDAAEARAMGLVHRVVEPIELLAQARELAADIAASPSGSVVGLLRFAATWRRGDREAMRIGERHHFIERWRSPEFQRVLAERRANPRSSA
jgi:enoyl-CoA hydratase/carnithine racemase